MTIVWCAQLQHVPIAIEVAEVGLVRGMICTLGAEGGVQVSYLGTEPPPQALVNTEIKELDYADMEEEHQALLGVTAYPTFAGYTMRRRLFLAFPCPAGGGWPGREPLALNEVVVHFGARRHPAHPNSIQDPSCTA